MAATLTLAGKATAGGTTVARGRFALSGEPWLPWGVYMQGASATDLATIHAAGFNTVLAYEHGPVGLPDDGAITNDLPVVKEFLDAAASHDLQVFFALNGFFDIPPYNETRGTNWTTSVRNTPAGQYHCQQNPTLCLVKI